MAAQVVRDGNQVRLETIDKFQPWQQNTVISCYATAMRAVGEDCTYPYLMGVSGAAFRFQLSQGGWCGSSPHAYCGFQCGKAAVDALPYEVVSYPGKADDPNTVAKARAAVVASIDAGVPALASSEESSLIVGYVDGGAAYLRRTVWGGDPNGPPAAWKGTPWAFDVFKPKAVRPDRKQAIRNSLKQAVMIATADRFVEPVEKALPYDAGIKAMQRWIVELRVDDAAFARLDANSFSQQMNAWIYPGPVRLPRGGGGVPGEHRGRVRGRTEDARSEGGRPVQAGPRGPQREVPHGSGPLSQGRPEVGRGGAGLSGVTVGEGHPHRETGHRGVETRGGDVTPAPAGKTAKSWLTGAPPR